MTTRFIFIVGVSRSGTTLMRKILNNSDQVAICNENHFLGHLIPSEGVRYKFRRFGDLSDDENVRRLVDFIYSGGLECSVKHRTLSYHWRWIIRKVDREDFLQRILASDRSERALFTIMMQVFADHRDRPIMGEKTPAHLRYVPTLMEWFPDGKVIHMLRDPRAIFTSELRRRREIPITPPFRQLKRFDLLLKLYIVLQTTIVWFEGVTRGLRWRKRYPDNYYLLRFEDLVNDPKRHIEHVCDYLGIRFHDKMLDQVVVSRGFQMGQAGFDAQAATRWKEHIPRWVNLWFSFSLGKSLREFGYVE